MGRKPTGNPKPCVYRYVDRADGIVKYVGIVYKGSLAHRVRVHDSADPWFLDGCWLIQYFECENQSEAEAFESHLIALYGTWRYYNKAKKDWGINRFLPNVESWWKNFRYPGFDSLTALRVGKATRKFMQIGRFDLARVFLECLDYSKEANYGKTDWKS